MPFCGRASWGWLMTGWLTLIVLPPPAPAGEMSHGDAQGAARVEGGAAPVVWQQARILRERGEILPLEVILHRAGIERRRLLEVEMKSRGDRVYYELELIDARSRVREVEVDARSGAILREEAD